ncbi:MAG: hypothetical protein GY943_23330 [Chloroflexi bacterium]|nr:hypothetical protein [Chloroflexota bacterium]
MSRNTKIIVGIIGGILTLCCLIAIIGAIMLPRLTEQFVEETVVDDPAKAAEVGQSITNYDLPSGFSEEGGMSLLGINMVIASSENVQGSVIMLMSFPESLAGDEAGMQRQMEQSFRQQNGSQNVQLAFEGTEDIIINGEGTTLTIYEGVDDNGLSVRQATAIFAADSGGPGMVMIFAPIDTWDAQGFDGFLTSME